MMDFISMRGSMPQAYNECQGSVPQIHTQDIEISPPRSTVLYYKNSYRVSRLDASSTYRVPGHLIQYKPTVGSNSPYFV